MRYSLTVTGDWYSVTGVQGRSLVLFLRRIFVRFSVNCSFIHLSTLKVYDTFYFLNKMFRSYFEKNLNSVPSNIIYIYMYLESHKEELSVNGINRIRAT